jgi:putative tryptophan/tyrosine transport system substrate-binding protein
MALLLASRSLWTRSGQSCASLDGLEGKNLAIEYRFGEEKPGRLPELAGELVHLKVDLILVGSVAAALAAKRTTTTIPVLMTNVGDPVGSGLVASLARPGGNDTGFASFSPELNTKRLEILKDLVPKLTRVGLLKLPGSNPRQLEELRGAAQALKLILEEIETQLGSKGLESVFQTAKQKQVGAIMTVTSRTLFAERNRIVVDKFLLKINSW